LHTHTHTHTHRQEKTSTLTIDLALFIVRHCADWTGLMLHSARELVFTRNKLIVFTTSQELSYYVVFSGITAERKVGVVLNSIVFSFYVHIPLVVKILGYFT